MMMMMRSFTSPSKTLETSSPSASLFRAKGSKSCRATFTTKKRSRNRPSVSVVVVAKASNDAKNSRDSIKTNAKKKGGAQNEQKFDWEDDFGDDFVPAGKAKKIKRSKRRRKRRLHHHHHHRLLLLLLLLLLIHRRHNKNKK